MTMPLNESPNHRLTIPFEPRLLEFMPPDPFEVLAPRAHPGDLIERMDLTSLQSDDNNGRIRVLCARAKQPVTLRPNLKTAAVCVYPVFVPFCKEILVGTGIFVATVAGGFPHGLSPLASRVHEVSKCFDIEADEIDVVIRRSLALEGDWLGLYNEIAQLRLAAQDRVMKVILATGELAQPDIIFRSSMVALMAGADFIKTSTGKESVNATIEAGTAMVHALRVFGEKTGRAAGLKAAGGIRTYEEADQWYQLVYQRLGSDAVHPSRFRIGASSLLDDLAPRIH